MRPYLATLFVLTSALPALMAAAPLAAEEYRLAAGDVVKVTVVDEPSLSVSEVRLQSAGRIMLPGLGTVTLEGLTPDEARDQVAAELRTKEGLIRPDVLIEIVEYRPFFVAGDVTDPGEYEFLQGMTVLQALSLAGGFMRPEPADTAVRLEWGRLVQALGQYRQQLAQSLVRHVRLLAERDGGAMAIPESAAALVGADRLTQLVAAETALKEERKRALDGEIAILEGVQAEFDSEAQSLRAQYEARNKQSALIREEAAKVQGLAARDLVSLQRSIAAQSAAIQVDADKLEILAFISRAQTGRQKAEQEKQNLRSNLALDILNGLKAEEDSIALLEDLIASTRDQIDAVDRLAGGLGALEMETSQSMQGTGGSKGITVLRQGGVIVVGLLDVLKPDDVVFVPYQATPSPGVTP